MLHFRQISLSLQSYDKNRHGSGNVKARVHILTLIRTRANELSTIRQTAIFRLEMLMLNGGEYSGCCGRFGSARGQLYIPLLLIMQPQPAGTNNTYPYFRSSVGLGLS